MNPKRILMIKSHSMGVGDVLRSSAAWRVLKNKWPEVELHLLFLSKHAGYATESLIKQHHLLSSAHFITVRAHDPSVSNAARVPITTLIQQVQTITRELKPELIIDFEPHGMKTSLLTWMAARVCQAKTLGIAQFPGRSWFYDQCANSVSNYAQSHGLSLPMNYTNRDFVVLQALGLERSGTPIELALCEEGERFKQKLMAELPRDLPVVGLNIGCGTQDAVPRRPDLHKLAKCILGLFEVTPFTLVLSGAAFEKEINLEFTSIVEKISPKAITFIDCAGLTTLLETTGLIAACDLFVSSDSGPYHMSVGLKIPTLVWFNFSEPAAIHHSDGVEALINPGTEEFVAAIDKLAWLKSHQDLSSSA